jgi:CubicO group peptidase (beta-lactamase class C family)
MPYFKRFLVLLCFCSPVFLSAQTPSFIRDSIDSYINKGLKDWDLPGLAIVVVKDGKVVVMKGYGYRDIDKKTNVDENTLFMIASNTKLFTGTVMSKLDYEKKISLNDKITNYFPDYKLYLPSTTELVTIRDLLSHRIGTKTFQGDFTFWNSNLSRSEIMHRMRLLKPVAQFRQDYGYCNSCFLTAGEVVQKVTGIPWEKYVQDSILSMLNMTHSTTISNGMESKQNVAVPYTDNYVEKISRVPYDQWDNLGPAASIISNVNDLSHWLFFQLDSGRYNGKRILPWSVLQQTRDVNIITNSRKSALFPIHFRGYGLGLFSADYNGKQIYWHTGGAGGMVSNVCFVPEEKLGIAILTNNDNQSFFEALRYQVLDAYLGVPWVNRSKQMLAPSQVERKEQLEKLATWKEKLKLAAKPPMALTDYTGEYTNELYGTMTMNQKDGHLVARFNSHKDLVANLSYLEKDEWLLQYENVLYGVFVVKFTTSNGKVNSVEIKANDFVEYDPYTFTKSR